MRLIHLGFDRRQIVLDRLRLGIDLRDGLFNGGLLDREFIRQPVEANELLLQRCDLCSQSIGRCVGSIGLGLGCNLLVGCCLQLGDQFLHSLVGRSFGRDQLGKLCHRIGIFFALGSVGYRKIGDLFVFLCLLRIESVELIGELSHCSRFGLDGFARFGDLSVEGRRIRDLPLLLLLQAHQGIIGLLLFRSGLCDLSRLGGDPLCGLGNLGLLGRNLGCVSIDHDLQLVRSIGQLGDLCDVSRNKALMIGVGLLDRRSLGGLLRQFGRSCLGHCSQLNVALLVRSHRHLESHRVRCKPLFVLRVGSQPYAHVT